MRALRRAVKRARVQKIVIEIIGMEQTRPFQSNGSTMPIFVIEIVIDFFSARSEKF